MKENLEGKIYTVFPLFSGPMISILYSGFEVHVFQNPVKREIIIFI